MVGGGGGSIGGSEGGGNVCELPVSKDVQPAVRKTGAFEVTLLLLLVGIVGGSGGDAGAREAHPDFLGAGSDSKPSVVAETRIGTSILPVATSMAKFRVDIGFAILIPLAAAILRSSFSSRFLSFSFLLSISSLGFKRTLACMSLKRAL
jgi:hypothetical protein